MNKEIEEKEEKEEKEKCVVCGKETQYFRNTPIDKREHYVEGVGQVCEECAIE